MKVRRKWFRWEPDNQQFVIKKHNTICIPRGGGLQHQLFYNAQDAELAGHFGTSRTYNALNERFFWPRMLASVQSYVSTGDSCQRVKESKIRRHLTLLPVAEGRWTRIGMDVVTGLPMSDSGNDCIWTIIDYVTKTAHWFALWEKSSAGEFVWLFIPQFVRVHGVRAQIVSDRDVRFTSDFCKALWKPMDSCLTPSTPFHPQTDGQAEKANDMCARYLKTYATKYRNQWDDILPLAEFCNGMPPLGFISCAYVWLGRQ